MLKKSEGEGFGFSLTHRGDETVVAILLSIKNPVLNEHGYCTEDERDKKVHMDEIPSAVKLPGEERGKGGWGKRNKE